MAKAAFDLTATEMVRGFADLALSPVEVMASVLGRIEQVNPRINALVFMDADAAMREARESEARWSRGEPVGILDGVPVSIKDSIAVRGKPMLRGMKANEGAVPGSYDAPPAARVREAGGIIFAKSTMPDFGLLAAGVSSAYGITRNPWNSAFNPGGSSSGAAASIAARCGPLAVGSDIGGSVRLPAALCGLVGLKPTQGRIAHLPPSPIRSAGPLARTVEDLAFLLDVLSRYDAQDYYALPPEGAQCRGQLKRDVRGVRIALMMEADDGSRSEPIVEAAVQTAAERFMSAGAIVEEVPCVVGAEFMDTVAILFLMRGYTEMAHLSEEAKRYVPEHFLRWFDRIDEYRAVDVGAALDHLERIKARVLTQLTGYDYMLSPVLAVSGFAAEATRPEGEANSLGYTPIWNQTGNPAISICCGFDSENGLPIGLQIIGQRFDDLGVLQMAAAYEQLRDPMPAWPD